MTDAHNTAPADPASIAQSLEGMKAATAAHCGSWHLDQAERWSVDMDEGLIRFVLPDGMHASAPVQIVGTTNSDDGSFLWAGITRPCRRNWPNTPNWRSLRRSPWIARVQQPQGRVRRHAGLGIRRRGHARQRHLS